MRWYVSQNGKSSGPFREERLAMMVKWGKVSRGAFICDTQLSAWIAIERSAFSPLLPNLPPVAAGTLRRLHKLERLVKAPLVAALRGVLMLAAALLFAGLLAAALGMASSRPACAQRRMSCHEAAEPDHLSRANP